MRSSLRIAMICLIAFSVRACVVSNMEHQQRIQLATYEGGLVVGALERYFVKHKRYPDKLSETKLSPEIIGRVKDYDVEDHGKTFTLFYYVGSGTYLMWQSEVGYWKHTSK